MIACIIEKEHTIKGSKVNVQAYDERSEMDPKKVTVSGLSAKIDEETLQLYFENPRSGGGAIESVEIQGSKGFIVFSSKEGKTVFKLIIVTKRELRLSIIIYTSIFCFIYDIMKIKKIWFIIKIIILQNLNLIKTKIYIYFIDFCEVFLGNQ